MRFERALILRDAGFRLLRIGKSGCRLSGLLLGGGDVENAHDVALLHDQKLLAIDLHLGPGPLAEQHAVADLEVDREQFSGFVAAARTYREISPCEGFSLAVSGIIMPPAVFSSAS